MKLSRRLLALIALTSLAVTGASAQVASTPPPQRYQLDANGVDLVTLTYVSRSTDVSIGPAGPSQLSYQSNFGTGNGGSDNYELSLYNPTGNIWAAQTGLTSEYFTQSGATFTSDAQQGSTLVKTGTASAPIYTLTASNGTQIVYDVPNVYSYTGPRIGASKIVYPSGDQISLTWTSVTYCTKLSNQIVAGGGTERAAPSPANADTPAPQGIPDCGVTDQQTRKRIQAVSNNSGYQLHYEYQNDLVDVWNDNGLIRNNSDQWLTRTKVIGINTAVEACDPSAAHCTLTGNWPAATYGYSVSGTTHTNTITDPAGRTTTYTIAGATQSIRRPSSATNNISVTTTSDSSGVTGLTYVRDGQTWSYARSGVGTGTVTTTITNPLNQQTVVTARENIAQLLTVKNALNQTTTYTYDTAGRLLTAQAPEGDKSEYSYDGRGNITQVIQRSKDSYATTITSSGYTTSCANPVTCNQPVSSTDAGGNMTSYSYDPTHGGVTTVTAPAGPNGVHPEVRYGYTSYGGIYRQTTTSACRTAASCANASDETRTTVSYSGANLLPTSSTSASGDGSVSVTTTIGYDSVGNVTSVDGPLPGSADTTRATYNADRQMIATIGPDPDGSGPLLARATVYAYTADGQLYTTAVGTVSSPADTALSSFVEKYHLTNVYDGNARVIRQTYWSLGSDYAVVDYLYDALGRQTCSITYMDPAQWGPQAGSCAPLQTNGPNGPDRVTRTSYDALSRPYLIQTAYGTAAQSDEATLTFTPNGQQSTMTDGNGNITTYEYDGFDRLVKTRYPNSAGGGSSSSDYVALGYDSRGNVTTQSLRGNPGALTTITYDALNRPTHVALPGGSWADPAKDFSYDNFGNMIQAVSGNTHARFQSFDALGRKTYQADSLHGFSMQYDAAGRRTRLSWDDGFYVTYDYDNVGELTAIRENGSTVLAGFAYDDLGRRTTLTRGNGTTTSYAYDNGSRLTSLVQDLGGTAQDLTLGFTYNPANQIVSNTRSNDLYAWNGHYNVNRPYTINGLNQVATSGGITPDYDNKGNMRSGAGILYDYSVENQLAQATPTDPSQPTWQLNYAATGELESVGTHLGFQYVDGQMVDEVSDAPGFPIQRRYIFGPGADEPLVWYEGGSTAQKYWLHADERGSVVAITDASGNAVGTNTYDEYGTPNVDPTTGISTNIGRFQYTGQVWLSEIGLYYYKARMYSPTHGRFMQTDPIGYGAGVNMYGYVGADPINATDPSGLAQCGDRDSYNNGACTPTNPGSGTCAPDGTGCPPILVEGKPRGSAAAVNSPGGPVARGNEGTGSERKPHDQINEITCKGPGRVMAGNPRGVGKVGGMLRPINPGSAAIVPRQFPNGAGRGGSASPYLRSISPGIRGTTAGGQRFSGADDVINDGRIAPTALDAQNIEMARDPDRLLIELVNGRDEGRTTVIVTVPGNSCPANTSPARGH